MDTFVFQTNAVSTFTKFQIYLIKEGTQYVLSSPPPVPPSFYLRLVTYYSAHMTENDLY